MISRLGSFGEMGMFNKEIMLPLALLLPIATWLMIDYPRGVALPTDTRDLEAISGGHFCSENDVVDIESVGALKTIRPGLPIDAAEYRRAVLSSFPNNQFPCINLGLWPDSLKPARPGESFQLRKITGFIQIDGAKVPLVLTRRVTNKAHYKNFDGRIFVRLSGGPGGIPVASLTDYIIPLSEQDILIDFFYAGSGTNLIYPAPNFGVAVTQVRSFIKGMRDRNPNAQILLLGQSLGAVIGAAAVERHALEGEQLDIDSLVLLSPPTSSMRDFIDFSEGMSRGVDHDSLLEIYRVINSEKDDWNSRNIAQLNRIEVLTKFFDIQDLDVSLVARLLKATQTPTLLLYGDEDPVVLEEDIEKIRSLPNVAVEKIDGMHHTFSTLGHVEDMRYAINNFQEQ